MYAMVMTLEASPYDNVNVHRPGFRVQVYFPRCAQMANLDYADGRQADQHGSRPSSRPTRAMTAGKNNLIRMTTGPTL